jgi:hypothetical protein
MLELKQSATDKVIPFLMVSFRGRLMVEGNGGKFAESGNLVPDANAHPGALAMILY